jgi:hypothetical protein
MTSTSGSTSGWDRFLSRRNIGIYSIIWAIVALIFYLLYGLSIEEERPSWYRMFVSILMLNLPLFFSTILCWRNAFNRTLQKTRKVWLGIGLAIMLFGIGNCWFTIWELAWNLNPSGSLGDVSFIFCYLLLVVSVFAAVVMTRVKLNGFQWFALAGVATYATLFAVGISFVSAPSETAQAIDLLSPPAHAATISPTVPAHSFVLAQATETKPEPAAVPAEPESTAPEWAKSIDSALKPYTTVLNLFYVWCDVILLCLSAVMIMSSWSKKANRAWMITAMAIICFYISDMWLAYAIKNLANYQTGFFLELFWNIGALLFGYAAVTDFEVARLLLARQQQVEAAESVNRELMG